MNKMTQWFICLVTVLVIAGTSHAATLSYWRMGDDTNDSTDSSGNGNHLDANTGTQSTLPGSGDGSTFPNPVPQNGLANTQASNFNGTNGGDRAIIDDFYDSSSDFTIETFYNMSAANNSRDQFIVSQYQTVGDQRSWALGIADGDSGNSGAGAGELFMWMSSDGTFGGSSIVPLGLTVAANTDYYVAVGVNNTTDTNDISFYYQDLTNSGSLQFTSLSSGFTSLHNSSGTFEVGAFNSDSSNFAGLIDEMRLSDTVLSQSELLIVPELSSISFMLIGFGLLGSARWIRRGRV